MCGTIFVNILDVIAIFVKKKNEKKDIIGVNTCMKDGVGVKNRKLTSVLALRFPTFFPSPLSTFPLFLCIFLLLEREREKQISVVGADNHNKP